MILCLFLSIFYGYGSASSLGAYGVIANPAGMKIRTEYGSFSILRYPMLTSVTYLGDIGFCTISDTLTKIKLLPENYIISIAPLSLQKGELTLFGGYSFIKKKDKKFHRIGFLLPLSDKIFLGSHFTYSDDKLNYEAGIFARPLKFVDIKVDVIKDTSLEYNLGALFKIQNFEFWGDYLLNVKRYRAGFLFKYKRLGFGVFYDKGISFELCFLKRSVPLAFLKKKRIAEVVVKGSYPEIKIKGDLMFGFKPVPYFYNFLSKIHKLSKIKGIKAVLFNLKDFNMSYAQVEEVREEIMKLKKKGVKIIFYSPHYGPLSYYLASCGDYVIISPMGEIYLGGLAVYSVHFKKTLDKLDIEVDTFRVGKYKSAIEAFARDKMSDEDREQTMTFLKDLWKEISSKICERLKITEDSLMKIVNEKIILNDREAVSLGFCDTFLYEWEVKNFVKKKIGRYKITPIDKILSDFSSEKSFFAPKIAVVIAEGNIILGESNYSQHFLFGEQKLIGSETMKKIFSQIERDKRIKGVVFRVNSGGGDALASEIIAKSLEKCRKKKPVVVSMGEMAASGGYYISCLSDKIYADKMTLTGSIGVLSLKLILKGLYDKLGITFDTLKIGEHALMWSDLRKMNEKERKRVKELIKWFYDKFIERVSEGRGLSKSYVDSIAQGRIWSGLSALNLKLIDKNGNIFDAIEEVKNLAKVKKPEIEVIILPKKKKRKLLPF